MIDTSMISDKEFNIIKSMLNYREILAGSKLKLKHKLENRKPEPGYEEYTYTKGWLFPKTFCNKNTIDKAHISMYLNDRLTKEKKILSRHEFKFKDKRGRPNQLMAYKVNTDKETFKQLFIAFEYYNEMPFFFASDYFKDNEGILNSLKMEFIFYLFGGQKEGSKIKAQVTPGAFFQYRKDIEAIMTTSPLFILFLKDHKKAKQCLLDLNKIFESSMINKLPIARDTLLLSAFNISSFIYNYDGPYREDLSKTIKERLDLFAITLQSKENLLDKLQANITPQNKPRRQVKK